MLKVPSFLALLIVGALGFIAHLSFPKKGPDTLPLPPSKEVSTASITAPKVPEKRRPVMPRKSASLKTSAAVAVQGGEASPQAPQKPRASIPLPSFWESSYVERASMSVQKDCGFDRPCTPMGRDGVLLVGIAVHLPGKKSQTPGGVLIGSFNERTPLLVYK